MTTSPTLRAPALTAEQEEGPFYVGVDRARSDIALGQAGLLLNLTITIINSTTCKPLRDAAVDLWQCNASGVYSDESSESTLGRTYLRGVQFTDKRGQVNFRTVFPGHYAGRTTHIHAKVHVGSSESGTTLIGGHVAQTGQMFPSRAVYQEVYKLSPYNAETATIVTPRRGSRLDRAARLRGVDEHHQGRKPPHRALTPRSPSQSNRAPHPPSSRPPPSTMNPVEPRLAQAGPTRPQR